MSHRDGTCHANSLLLVITRSHVKTWMRAPSWLSRYVVGVGDCFVGVGETITFARTPSVVSQPINDGVTLIYGESCTCEDPTPVRTAACTAAPKPTSSSGFMDLLDSFPLKNSWNVYSFTLPYGSSSAPASNFMTAETREAN